MDSKIKWYFTDKPGLALSDQGVLHLETKIIKFCHFFKREKLLFVNCIRTIVKKEKLQKSILQNLLYL